MFLFRPRFLLFLMAALITGSGSARAVDDATLRDSGRVEIVIRNSVFEFQGGHLTPDQLGTIRIKNKDRIRHGFTSPAMQEWEVYVDSPAGTVYGKGIQGVYLNPGESLEIRLTPNRPGRFPFRCDLHPEMKGELAILSVEGV